MNLKVVTFGLEQDDCKSHLHWNEQSSWNPPCESHRLKKQKHSA